MVSQALSSFGGGTEKAGLKKWPGGMMLNVNVPNTPLTKIKGIRAATQGKRIYGSHVLKRTDSRGRDYFWIGGSLEGYAPIPESDCWYVDHGYVSVSPLELDTTYTAVYEQMKEVFAKEKGKRK